MYDNTIAVSTTAASPMRQLTSVVIVTF